VKHQKITVGLSYVNGGRIAIIVIAVDQADHIYSNAANMIDLENLVLVGTASPLYMLDCARHPNHAKEL